jgi:hypothetical protein
MSNTTHNSGLRTAESQVIIMNNVEKIQNSIHASRRTLDSEVLRIEDKLGDRGLFTSACLLYQSHKDGAS